MKKLLVSFRTTTLITLLSAICSTPYAQGSAVYRCTADDAPPTYTNNPQGLKGCEIVSGVAVTTVPAFRLPPVRTGTVSNNAGPADFPKIDIDLQKQRDELGRRPILERELRDREERCTISRKDSNNGAPAKAVGEETAAYNLRIASLKTQVERCEADLTAIRRELGALK